MILLNGLPPIMGATLVHVVFINILAIWIEYAIIKNRFKGSMLMLRVILSNLISVLAGTIVVYKIPELLGGAIDRPDSHVYSNYEIFALGIGLIGLFLCNVLLEIPAYLIKNQVKKEDISRWSSAIIIANLVTNIPVVLIYMFIVI